MAASGGYDYPGGNNQDNSWLGCVFVFVIVFYLLVVAGIRFLASH